MSLNTMVLGVCGVIAIVVQAVLAPVIALGDIVPNIILGLALASAVMVPGQARIGFAFLLGFVYDVLGSGPVGAMALVLTLAAFVLSRAYFVLDNQTVFIPLVLLICMVPIVDIVYGSLIVLCGYPAALGEVLLFRSLPCALYDVPFALVWFIVLRLLLGERTSQSTGALPMVGAAKRRSIR